MWRSRTSGRAAILAALLCALALAGCTNLSSGIDPSGDRVFAAPPPPTNASRADELYRDDPLGRLPWDDVAVELQPAVTVASLGSEVVLIAGVCGPDGYLRMNRRLEWSIDQGGVGQFVAVEEGTLVDMMLGDFNRPRRVTNTFAVGSTSRINTRLNRGTCDPNTNVYVLRGQGWVSLTSAVEGTSHVTVVAPDVYSWNNRLKSATVHWVDAEWQFPPPAINPAGSKHVFTTCVTRASNHTPCERWTVRYEIVDGPPAGFLPDGAQAVEVTTDSAGQAHAEIVQKEQRHGTNKVAVQVIRPPDVPGANGQRLVVGSGTTTKTWTGADLAVKATGPASANVGDTLSYHVDVSNPGDLAVKDVIATMTLPDGLAYVDGNPLAEVSGRQLRWRIVELGARQQASIDARFRAERAGSVSPCWEVAAAGAPKATDCVSTTIGTGVAPSATPGGQSQLDLRVTGPADAKLDGEVQFNITMTNVGQTPATGLYVRAALDPGLQHPAANLRNAIEPRYPKDIPSGGSQKFSLTPKAIQPGRQCVTVEVSGKGIAPVSKTTCVNVAGGTSPALPTTPTTPPGKPPFSVQVTAPPKDLAVGDTVTFTIQIHNNGPTPLENLTVVNRPDPKLFPILATDGFTPGVDGILTWNIKRISAGKVYTLAVEYRCQAAALRAFNRVSVTSPDGMKETAEKDVEIRAPAPATPTVTQPTGPNVADLKVSVVPLRNPVALNRELGYQIQVENVGATVFRQVRVAALLPQGMTASAMGTFGPGSTKSTIAGKEINFDPIDLAPGKPLTYLVRVQATEPGNPVLRIALTSPDLPEPLSQDAKPIEVFQPPKTEGP